MTARELGGELSSIPHLHLPWRTLMENVIPNPILPLLDFRY